MKNKKDIKTNETKKGTVVQTKAPKRDKPFNYVLLFALIFAFVVGRALFAPNTGTNTNNPAGVQRNSDAPKNLDFSQILTASDAKEIATMELRGTTAAGTMVDGTKYTAQVVYDPALLSRISDSGAAVQIRNEKTWVDALGTWVPILMGILFIWWIFRGLRGPMGGPGGAKISNYNPTKITMGAGKSKTTFADVAGIEQEKREVSEIVDFLKTPEKFKALGARVPRGVLLSGEPGTGKTLLARAIAGEANVPFFATSGSDFSGIIVGLGVAKIKEIFEMAKKHAPCIMFIDEIDAIGAQRGHGSFNDQDREQTLNQLLIEMDGFANDSGIIVIGATNRPDMLDKALLRPGRFDRQVYIELPDLKARKEILALHAKKIKLATGVSLDDLARGTTGMSGADLENVLNEAALLAARNGKKEIVKDDIEEARDKILMGPVKTRKMRAEDRRLAAYHEAGHAFVSIHYRDLTDPIHKATIIPRGNALGMVQKLPVDDKVSLTVSEIHATLAVYMAGRATEEIFFGPNKITTGAEADIAASTRLTRYAITTAGLSKKVGLPAINQVVPFGARTALENASEKTAQMVDEEVKSWMSAAYTNATKILTKNKTMVKKLAEELLARETLTREEIEKILGVKAKKS